MKERRCLVTICRNAEPEENYLMKNPIGWFGGGRLIHESDKIQTNPLMWWCLIKRLAGENLPHCKHFCPHIPGPCWSVWPVHLPLAYENPVPQHKAQWWDTFKMPPSKSKEVISCCWKVKETQDSLGMVSRTSFIFEETEGWEKKEWEGMVKTE